VLASYSSGVTGGTELKGGLIIAELGLLNLLSHLTVRILKAAHVQRSMIAAGSRLSSVRSPLIENRGCGLLLRNMLLRAQQTSCTNMNIYILYVYTLSKYIPYIFELWISVNTSDTTLSALYWKWFLEYCQLFFGVNGSGNKLKKLQKCQNITDRETHRKISVILICISPNDSDLNVANEWMIMNNQSQKCENKRSWLVLG
jgi:uncharacterized membrane protein